MFFFILLLYLYFAPAVLTRPVPLISGLLSSGYNEAIAACSTSDPSALLLAFSRDVSTSTSPSPSHQRSIWNIVWSCLATIVACSWKSVHPDIPADGEKPWRNCLRRMEYLFWTLMAPELIIWWASRQWSGAWRIEREQRSRGWTVTHGHFMQMGGFVLFKGDERIGTLSYDRFLALLEKRRIAFPKITQKEIEDRSKSDGLSKTLVVAQTGWFVMQCIARRFQGLPISELELSTLAFAALNGFMCFFWWNKPFDIQCPLPVYLLPTDQSDPGDSPRMPTHHIEPTSTSPNQHHWRRYLEQSYTSILNWSGWESLITFQWPWTFVLFIGGRLRSLGEDKDKNRAFDACDNDEDDAPGPLRVPTFYSLNVMNEQGVKSIYLVVPLVGSLYGAIHCWAWHFQFPTTMELWVWRISSVIITAVPISVYVVLGVVMFLETVFPILENATFITLCLHLAVYLLARLVILAEAISTLRDLPPRAFDIVQWTSFIPHI